MSKKSIIKYKPSSFFYKSISLLIFLFALAVFFVYISSQYQIPDYDTFSTTWLKGVGICLLLTLCVYLLKRYVVRSIQAGWNRLKLWNWDATVVGMFLFSFVWHIPFQFVNGYFDKSIETTHDVLVLGKNQYSQRSQTWYGLELQSWRKDHKSESVEVSVDFYYRIKPHISMVRVYTKSGLLGWEWVSKIGELVPKGKISSDLLNY